MTVMLPPRPNSLVPYVDWVLAHDAGAEPAARELMESVESGLLRAYEKPGRFLDDMTWLARRLPPAHLPPFWDSVAHRMSLFVERHAVEVTLVSERISIFAAAARAALDEATLPLDTSNS